MNTKDKLKEIQEKMRGTTKKEDVKVEPRQKSRTAKYYTPKGGQGGARANSGPAPLPPELQRKTLKGMWRDFGLGEVEIKLKEIHRGNVTERIVKMKRVTVVQEALYKKAREGDVGAIKEMNDRIFNKSAQPMIGDNDEDAIKVEGIPVGSMLKKVYGKPDRPK